MCLGSREVTPLRHINNNDNIKRIDGTVPLGGAVGRVEKRVSCTQETSAGREKGGVLRRYSM